MKVQRTKFSGIQTEIVENGLKQREKPTKMHNQMAAILDLETEPGSQSLPRKLTGLPGIQIKGSN